MNQALPVHIPLLNTNEIEASLVFLHVKDGQKVKTEELLCTLETTKSTADVVAEQDGYVVGLRFLQGDTVKAGDILCFLAKTPDWTPPQVESVQMEKTDSIPEGLRITKPALTYARQNKIDLSQLPVGPLVTENQIRAFHNDHSAAPIPSNEKFKSSSLVIYGGGGHGKALIELIHSLGNYSIHGIIDDNLPKGQKVMEVPVLGGRELLPTLYADGIRLAVNAVGGIGQIHSRIQVFRRILSAKFTCPTLIHPTAFFEPSVSFSSGAQIFPNTYIGSDAQIGYGVIVNTGAIISHDCEIAEYTNIAPGAILAGSVQIGAGSLIGMGVTINLNVSIGNNARIGNNATIKSDVPDGGIVRAGAIWPER
jgi:sugar O-acyltransferase (sialic acid O-acetyltransferase NeuD family)